MCDVVATEMSYMVARGLAGITAAGFLTQLTESVIEDVHNHIQVSRLRVFGKTTREGIEPVAFLASEMRRVGLYKSDDIEMYHLGGVIVAPEYQGKGMGVRLIANEIEETGADTLVFHTQSDHMQRAGDKIAEYSYSLSSALAEEVGTPNPVEKMLGGRSSIVHVGRYGGQSLYGDLNKFKRQGRAIKGLNYRNGDAIVYAGKVKEGK